MTFENNKAIYEQMADRLCDEIIAGTYKANDRIPSVREYAVSLQVNTNTAVKAYELLSRQEIIYNRRGLGYFVAIDARERIMNERRNIFLSSTLPNVFREMKLLGINMEEITERWQKMEQEHK